jgi:hypothetical protein
LQTAIRHPEVVDHLVVISSVMAQTGFYPEGLATFAQMSKNAPMLADSVKKSPLATMYPKTNWEMSFKKMGELASTPFDWSAQVKALKEPTLLVFADADAVRAEHIVKFYKALGGAQRDAGLDGSMRSMAQLAILPGTTHYNIIASPSLAVVIGEFLVPAQSLPQAYTPGKIIDVKQILHDTLSNTLRARQRPFLRNLPQILATVFPSMSWTVSALVGTEEFETRRYMTHTSVRKFGPSVPMAFSLLRRDAKLLRNSV